MIRAGVVGHPVSHSLSPHIHGYWFARYGLSGVYNAIDVASADLKPAVDDLLGQGYAGFNVTVPHKQAALALCQKLDDTARKIGAVNTVVIREGVIEGRNTDAYGFVENLRQQQPGFSFGANPALVLGAGGAARAAVYGLLQAGCLEIIVANRSRENAERLAGDFPGVKVVEWRVRERACADAGLLVNTTVLGMKGQEALSMNLSRLPPGSLVYDIVYKPLMTDLLQVAQEAGYAVVTGIGMLVHQARPAFAAWAGTVPEVTAELIRDITERAR
ncbi:MAG: shikimate dehydrogenase [Micavibrio aeruginosavorus]|uniref:Shikimate dehydrogenase (NADP(+)) n=1 Tax=Micavibrio aeruginosavorus TaxID=349221 RepID=A0A7T5R2L8_9BACT|nr:MAG: shikimate dehydrogenase [Micavibrio aeruginosavorus]